MLTELDHLLDGTDLGDPAQLTMADLRARRDRLNQIEVGLSYGRRMAQGRLDIVLCEIERRGTGGDASTHELLGRLPEVLASHTRTQGLPRPLPDVELPAFADAIVDDLDRVITPSDLGSIAELDSVRLADAIENLRLVEEDLSARRHEVHRRIDDIQNEIISRYRSGVASVDDLLRGS